MYKYTFLVFLFCSFSLTVSAQTDKVYLNEVKYVGPKNGKSRVYRFGSYVEVHNAGKLGVKLRKMYLTTDLSHMKQVRVSRTKELDRLRNRKHKLKGGKYRTVRLSDAGHKAKRRTLPLQGNRQTIYLVYDGEQGPILLDSIPAVMGDEFSTQGKCGTGADTLCTFTVNTPKRSNRDFPQEAILLKREYRASVMGKLNSASNTGFDKTQFLPSAGIMIEHVVHRRNFYTSTFFGVEGFGYRFDERETITTFRGTILREVKGKTTASGAFFGEKMGAYLHPRWDVFIGLGINFGGYATQENSEKTTFTALDGTRIEESMPSVENESYTGGKLMLLAGSAYRLTPHWRGFVSYSSNQGIGVGGGTGSTVKATRFNSINIGLTYALQRKNRNTYKNILLK